jgi:hypothetical protein
MMLTGLTGGNRRGRKGRELSEDVARAIARGMDGSTTRRSLLKAAFGVAAVGSELWRALTVEEASAAGAPYQPGCRVSSAFAGPAPRERIGPLLSDAPFTQLKDPCPVFDGSRWHLFGSGWSPTAPGWVVMHAHADAPAGPYTDVGVSELDGVAGPGVSAPGVVHDGAGFHMFIQTEFAQLGGRIEHLVSVDGQRFEWTDTALVSDVAAGESCIYDAQPAEIDGELYLAYAAATTAGQPDLHVSRSVSGTWGGPWERLGPMLRQHEVAFHNTVGCVGYEWGLEGPQLLALPGGGVLLIGVCFLPNRAKGRRQRVFFAVAPHALGPYRILGTALSPPPTGWDRGENGHAGGAIVGDDLVVLHQGRAGAGRPWQIGAAVFDVPTFHLPELEVPLHEVPVVEVPVVEVPVVEVPVVEVPVREVPVRDLRGADAGVFDTH